MDITRRLFVKSTAIALATAAAGGSLAMLQAALPRRRRPERAKARRHANVFRRLPFLRLRMRRHLRSKRRPFDLGDRRSRQPVEQGAQLRQGLLPCEDPLREDRLTKPLIRDDASTKGTPDGLREASWEEALDLVASKLRETWKADKTRLAFWGSGQQPITEGYLTSKLWKAGLRSNNIDPNARLCMASAVVAFMNVFQTDEPAGCYDDIDHADVFVTWGANMAEAHPMLYSRLTARKLNGGNVRHYDLGTIVTRTSASADKTLIFRPGTDLAIATALPITWSPTTSTMPRSSPTTASSRPVRRISATRTRTTTTPPSRAARSTTSTASRSKSTQNAWRLTPSSTPLNSPAFRWRTCKSLRRSSPSPIRKSCRCGPWA